MPSKSQSLIDLGSGNITDVTSSDRKSGMQHQRNRKRYLILCCLATLFLYALVTNWSPQRINFNTIRDPSLGDSKENDLVSEVVTEVIRDASGHPPQIAEPTAEIVNVEPKEEEDPDAVYKNIKPVWSYRCDTNLGCLRERQSENETVVEPEVCWLNCLKPGALWPIPTKTVMLGKCLSKFTKSDIKLSGVTIPGKEGSFMASAMWDVFMNRLNKLDAVKTALKLPPTEEKNALQASILVKESSTKISLDTDESYKISITSFNVSEDCETMGQSVEVNIQIEATTIFGARHGLETLSQLIAFDKSQNCFQIVNSVEIEDRPIFPYRGILIDTARNFIPVEDLKRLIDGLSLNKLNILHWHLSDSNSFPFYSKSVPQMTLYGAYSQEKVYYPTQVQDLVRYALIRGVKVIPEIDAPSHAGNGWQWGADEGLGDLAVCVNAQPWRNYCGQPPCGQLNPLNPNTLFVLEKLYRDFLEVFDDDIFHMGGDEVYSTCWESDPNISKWLRENKANYLDLWGTFQEEALERLKQANKNKPLKAIVWTGGMTGSANGRKFLNPSNYYIQVWDGSPKLIRNLIQEKYQLIISNIDAAYLDQGGGTWLGQKHVYPYRLWQQFYDNQISQYESNFSRDLTQSSTRQVLGSEATLWTEKVNSQNMDAKTFPRAAALAENLWAYPMHRTALVYSRLNNHNRRLIALGIHSDQLQPESCYLTSGHCDDPSSHI